MQLEPVQRILVLVFILSCTLIEHIVLPEAAWAPHEGLRGFPPGAALRPYVRLWGNAGDAITLETRYV